MYPSVGPYYVVPDKSRTGWTLLSLAERDPITGEKLFSESELCHFELLGNVVEYFKTNFSIDISGIGKRCLPRGRIEHINNWQVLHGRDTPTMVRNQIVDDFGLHAVIPDWNYSEFQSMLDRDQERLILVAPFMRELFDNTDTIK